MTRRDLIWAAAIAAGIPASQQKPLVVPVHRVMDKRTSCTPDQLTHFWWSVWPEAVKNFAGGLIQLQCTDELGEIRRSPGDRPIFYGLKRGAINLVVTDHVPMDWDKGRALAGATVLQEGYCVCVIAVRYAHGNQFPFLSTNTCVHELLHAFLQDIFVGRPTWYQSGARESRIDWYATQLWLFGNGAAIRQSAAECLRKLQPAI